MNTNQERNASLPLRRNLTLIYTLSFFIAILMAAASVAGLLYQTIIYPTDELLQSFVPNDVVNLFIGLPVLLGSRWLAWRGKLIGLLFWPGALFYVFYTYIVYLLSMPLNVVFLFYITLVTLSAYTMIGLLGCIDGKTVQHQLTGAVPERAAGGVLAGLGFLIFARASLILANAIISQTPIPPTEFALNVTDFLISPAWVIGGVLLWRREAFGYVTGLGLLFQASMLFIGVIFILILRPFMTAAQFVLSDVLVVFVMGMVCFVPLALFLRGASSKRNPAST